MVYHQPGCQERDIRAFPQQDSLAGRKYHVLRVEHRRFGAGEAQIYGAFDLRGSEYRFFGLHRVADRKDRHPRQRADERHVKNAVMACAIVSIRKSAVGSAELDIQMVIGDHAADRIGSAGGEKD